MDDSSDEITEKEVNPLQLSDTDNITADLQVKTARAYPRNISKALKNIKDTCTDDKEVAESCFYSIRRDGKTIRGASIRFAEIVSAFYGNIRASARVVSNDGKTVTAQGICWDLENNIAFNIEVKRKITKADGTPFTDDLVVVASNACCAVALRNAIFKTIPMAITARVQKEIKDVIIGKTEDFETTRKKAISYFINIGVIEKINITEKNILDAFNKKSIEDLDRDDVLDLRGIATAIKDGDTNLELAFSIAPKTNTAINKASRILSIPIEQGNAEYEKTNTANINKESERTKANIETEGIMGLNPKGQFAKTLSFDLTKEKEVVFGENTEAKNIDNIGEVAFGGVRDNKSEIIIPEVTVTNTETVSDIKKEEEVSKSHIDPVKFGIEENENKNIVEDKNITTDFIIDTPVITEKKEKKVKNESKDVKEGSEIKPKKKYKKYDKKNDTDTNANLFDQNNK